MTSEEIIEKLRTLMKTSSQAQIDWDGVTGESAIATLGFDSLSILDLIYDIQQEFKLDFEAEELTRINTVQEMANFLKSRGA